MLVYQKRLRILPMKPSLLSCLLAGIFFLSLPLVVFLHGAGSRLGHLSRIGSWMLGRGLLHTRNFQMVV